MVSTKYQREDYYFSLPNVRLLFAPLHLISCSTSSSLIEPTICFANYSKMREI
jgi:hypothetical protein